MHSTLLRLAVSLATCALGVALTALWAGFGAPTQPAAKRLSAPAAPRAVIAPSMSAAPQAPVPPAPADFPCASLPGNAERRPEVVDTPAQPLSGGVLNGKAVSKPAPAYPTAARAAGVSGTVVVLITVDECGRVESARPLSGPALLQTASTEAAYQARFSPTRLSGRPVKVSGTITYNYLLQ